MSKQLFTFRKQFLVEENYEKTKENSIKLNIKYQELCSLFERQFSILSNSKTNFLKQSYSVQIAVRRKNYHFLTALKDFIAEFIEIMERQAEYQIECLNNLRDQNANSFEIIFKLLQQVKENKVFCKDIQLKTANLFEKYTETRSAFGQNKKTLQNPLLFYKKEAVYQINQKMRNQIGANSQLIEEIKSKKLKVQQKIKEFQPILGTFRKKLIKNKYEVLQRVTKLINNIKYSYLLLADTIKNCATSKKEEFERITSDQSDDINYLKEFWNQIHQQDYLQHHSDQNRLWQKLINQTVSELGLELSFLEQTFSQLLEYFNNIRDKFTDQQLNLKNLLAQISGLFTENQCPNLLIKDLLSIQDVFAKKTNKLIVRLEDILAKLRQQRTSYKKHGEMFLTLIKVNKYNGRALSQGSKQQQNQEIIKLIDQLTFSNIKRTILLFYDDSIFLPNQLLDNFEKLKKRRQPNDSMDISHSHLDYRYPINKFTPLKEEVWLWKEWKTEVQINFQSYQTFFKEVQEYLDKSINSTTFKDGPILQKQACVLLGIKDEVSGELTLKINSLEFVGESFKLSIKLTEINKIDIKNSIFKDLLVLQTQRGMINFFKLEKLDYFANSIKEAQEKSLMGNNTKKLQKKPLLQLSSQELEGIKQRKQRIKPELPKLDEYTKIKEAFLKQYRIDEIFLIVYSDNPFSFYGKEEPCFFSYTGKKAGNYDWVAQKYDKPGPEFYTSNKEVNFKNCVVCSTRKVTYHHPMKPSAIPFMPKFCSNTDVRRMYWVSNQELFYQIESITEGVPYADHFVVFILHKITAVQNGVKLQIFYYIKWLKQTMMKSSIQGSIIPELGDNMNYFVNEIEKVLRLRGEIQRGESVAPELQAEDKKQSTERSLASEDLSKIKLHNKILIAGVLILLLVNILSFFIFSGQPEGRN